MKKEKDRDKKQSSKYLVPTEKVRGFMSSSAYAGLIERSSPAVRKQLLNLRKKESIKVSKQLAEKKMDQARFASLSSLRQQQLAREQAAKRQRIIGSFGSRAEQLEIEAVNLDEVPMLHAMERERTRKTMVSNKYLEDVEKSVTDSFPP